ncbi:MAG: glycosyltransferase, partial [bacterium]|nr:glycosyltransferase [bacterium]
KEHLNQAIIKNELESNIILTGNLSDTEITWLLKNSNGLIYPAWVTYGLVVLEALAEGLPVITADDTGIVNEITKIEKIDNLIVTDGSPEKIREKIISLKKKPFKKEISENLIKQFTYTCAFEKIETALRKNFLLKAEEAELNILMLPKFENPFQDILIEGLEEKSCNISVNFNLFQRKRLRQISDTVKILHLHWLDPFYLNLSSAIKANIASRSFLSKIKMLKSQGVKIIWTVHNTVNHLRKYEKLDRKVRKEVLNIADGIILMSNYAKARLEEEYKTKIKNYRIIPLPNYIGNYPNTVSRNDARRKLNLKEDAKVILLFGLLRRYKGLGNLIENRVFDKFPDIRWVIAGKPENPELKKELENELHSKENVSLFLDYIPDEDVQLYFNAADISILPYTDFLTSSNLILSLSFGHPVICTEHGYFKEILNGTKNFFFYREKPETLFKALQNAFSSNLNEIGESNRKIAVGFNPERIASETKEFYLEVLSR